MRDHNGTAQGTAETAMISHPYKIRGEQPGDTQRLVRQAGVACEASKSTALISFIHAGFSAQDIRGNREILPAANPGRRRCGCPQADSIVTASAPGSHSTGCSMRRARGIRKTGNGVGSESRFGKQVTDTGLDSPFGLGSFCESAERPIPPSMAMHQVLSAPRCKDSRHRAENRMAIDLQNEIRFVPRSGEREKKR